MNRSLTTWVFVFFAMVSFYTSSQADARTTQLNIWKNEASQAIKMFESENYENAFHSFYGLHQRGNLFATHYLGVMSFHGLYVKKDLDQAAAAFYQASKGCKEGGILESAYWLGLIHLNPDSKFYDIGGAYGFFSCLEFFGHADGALAAGKLMLKQVDSSKDPKATTALAKESLLAAKKAGALEANFWLFLIEKEQINAGEIQRYTTLDGMHLLLEEPSTAQGPAALELAGLYFAGVHVAKDDKRFLELLTIAADNGDAKASFLLGKAHLEGVHGDPDYGKAKFYLSFAKKKGFAGTDRLLTKLNQRIDRERKVDSFDPPVDWHLDFIATQFAMKRRPSKNRSQKNNYASPSSIWDEDTGSKFVTYHRSGNNFWGSDGNSFQVNGNTITGSDGSQFQVQGSYIHGSDGRSFNIIGSTIWGSDGSSYNVIGNTIMGNTGQSCSSSGLFTRCY